MGEDHACTPLRDHTRHIRVVPQPRHIVHDLRPTPQRLPSHRSVSRIDGQRSQTGFRRLSDEGQYPLEFLLHCYGIGAGTGGFPTHIQDLGALTEKESASLQSLRH